MAIEQAATGVAPGDRAPALLAELQAVCQRILANEGRLPGEPGHIAPTLIATANGTAVASSLEALRRQCADNNQQVAGLQRGVDALRGVMARDSADNAKLLVELKRAVEAMTGVVARENQEMSEVVRSVEALRVGLAGFSASNRQQLAELRGSVAALGSQVETALGGMGEQISTAFGTMAGQIQDAFNDFGQQVGQQMGRQSAAFDTLSQEMRPQHTRERLDELESLLAEGLPKFSSEIQAGVQQTLLEVSRTFQSAEREHGNRMAELHRDFDTTARRLEAAMQPRRREEPDRPERARQA